MNHSRRQQRRPPQSEEEERAKKEERFVVAAAAPPSGRTVVGGTSKMDGVRSSSRPGRARARKGARKAATATAATATAAPAFARVAGAAAFFAALLFAPTTDGAPVPPLRPSRIDHPEDASAFDRSRRRDRGLLADEPQQQRELATAFDGTEGTYGLMFDVSVPSDADANAVRIVGVDLHVGSINRRCAAQMNALIVSKSHVGYETNKNAWERIVNTQDAVCLGPGERTVLGPELFLSELTLSPGETRGLYATLSTPDLRHTAGSTAGTVAASDDYLVVREGTAVGGYFSEISSDGVGRIWNGAIHYAVVRTDAPSSMPSLRPSPRPSLWPSGAPSSVPSARPSRRPSGRPGEAPSPGPTVVAASEASSASPSETPGAGPSGTPSGPPGRAPSAPPAAADATTTTTATTTATATTPPAINRSSEDQNSTAAAAAATGGDSSSSSFSSPPSSSPSSSFSPSLRPTQRRNVHGGIDYFAGLPSPLPTTAPTPPPTEATCDPASLTTTYDDNLGSHGSMFDVRTKPDAPPIVVAGFDVNADSVGVVSYEVYTKEDSFQKYGMNYMTAWTLVGKGDVAGAERGKGTPVSFRAVSVPPNSTQGFYVTLAENQTGATLRYRKMNATDYALVGGGDGKLAVGDVYSSDDNVELLLGVGVADYRFATGTYYGPRLFAGTVRYEAGNGCTTSPTLAPTAAPSRAASAAPSTASAVGVADGPSGPVAAGPSKPPSMSPAAAAPVPPPTPPTLAPVSPPAPPNYGSNCTKIASLKTTLSGETGAFGNMFTVKSASKTSSIVIKTIEFYTDYVQNLVEVEVYTKKGGYQGFNGDPSAWTKIAGPVSVMGAGSGKTTLVPESRFDDVRMEPNELRAFYVTLTSADIRYSKGEKGAGEINVSDGTLEIHEGAGVANYPFVSELFEPRVFNGAFRYERGVPCATPGASPADPNGSSPGGEGGGDDVRVVLTDVPYEFSVEHPLTIPAAAVLAEGKKVVEAAMHELFRTERDLSDLVSEHGLVLGTVEGAIDDSADHPCIPASSLDTCTVMSAIVTVSHLSTVDSATVRYALLSYFDLLSAALNMGPYTATYVGMEPVLARPVIHLRNAPAVEMNAGEVAYFESVVLEELKGTLEVSEGTLKVTGVVVRDQSVNGSGGNGSASRRLSDGRPPPRRRKVQVSSSGGINVAIAVTGEYSPPPFIDFDELVDDALDGNDQVLDKLKNGGSRTNKGTNGEADFFQKIDRITTNPSVSAGDAGGASPTPASGADGAAGGDSDGGPGGGHADDGGGDGSPGAPTPGAAPSEASPALPKVQSANRGPASHSDGGAFSGTKGIFIICVIVLGSFLALGVCWVVYRRRKRKKQRKGTLKAQDYMGNTVTDKDQASDYINWKLYPPT